MKNHLILLSALLCIAFNADANEFFRLNFILMKDNKVIYNGKANVSEKQKTWSRGLKQNFLKLTCKKLNTGKIEKNLSTEEHFAGLMVNHKITDGVMNLTVSKYNVQPRVFEIRKLAKSECKDLSPIVSITTEHYIVPVSIGRSESKGFATNMVFNFKLDSI